MKIYKFTFNLPEIDDATVNAIYGLCQDASIEKSHGGMNATFDCESVSLEVAIDSAIVNLRKFQVEPVRIEMDAPTAAFFRCA